MKSYAQYCSLARGLDLVGDRWTLLIIRELLSLGPSRYSDLLRGLPGIATNLLVDRLRDLEAAGLVEKGVPARDRTAVFSLTERGAELRGVVRELVKWGAPLMHGPAATDAFRAHWLLVPLQGLCRDRSPQAPAQVIRVGSAEDGCDITAAAGTIRVAPADPDVDPDAVVDGDPGDLVALFSGHLPLDAHRAGALVSGDVGAVRRVVGGMPPTVAQPDDASLLSPSTDSGPSSGSLSGSGNPAARAAAVAWP